MVRRVFITAAEVSGDNHAAQLIRSLKEVDPSLVIEGIGGSEMAEAGCILHRDMVTHAAMGWRGALRAAEVFKILQWTRGHFTRNRPDLQIGVDSPSMNIHFAKVAKGMGVPVLQYVAPQLWAWAPARIKKYRRWVDRIACILPFEEEYFRSRGVNATFVGHPLFDQLPTEAPAPEAPRFPDRPPVIGLLPGSRRSEAQHNFPHMIEVARLIQRAFPLASFLVPTTAATRPVVEQVLASPDAGRAAVRERVRIEAGCDQFDEMVPRCDLCLTVSGTATLHVAALGVPMIVVYRVNSIAWNLAGRWLVPARTFALVNILADGSGDTRRANHLVPEFIPWYGSNDRVAGAALDLLKNPEKLRRQREQLKEVVRTLDRPGASMNVARLALTMIEGRNAPRSPAAVAGTAG
jgi:lipid-A-disaccharide synthase